MKYTVKRPEISVIFLDTHSITDIAYALKNPTDENKKIRDVYEKMIKLVDQKKILIYEADQMYEIGIRKELVDDSTTVFARLTRGLHTSKDVVEERQHVIGMKSFIKGEKFVEIPFESAFVGDPFEDRTIGGMVLTVNMLTLQMVKDRKLLNESIAEELELLRLKYIQEKVPEKARRERQTEAEFNGYAATYRTILARYVNRGTEPTDEAEFWQELNILKRPYSQWKLLGGKPDPVMLIDFYSSEFYKNLPHVDIWSRLAGQKIIIGEPVRRGDVADLHNIEHFMPYSHIMVLDRAMIGLVKTLKLDEKYDVKVCGLKDLADLLPDLEAI